MKIEFDSESRVIVVNGITISLELLQQMTSPRTDMCYSYMRVGDEVIVTSRVNEHVPISTLPAQH